MPLGQVSKHDVRCIYEWCNNIPYDVWYYGLHRGKNLWQLYIYIMTHT